jgi:hypothetical protein
MNQHNLVPLFQQPYYILADVRKIDTFGTPEFHHDGGLMIGDW